MPRKRDIVTETQVDSEIDGGFLNIEELDSSALILLGMSFSYDTLLAFLKENYKELYDFIIEEYSDCKDDKPYLFRALMRLDDEFKKMTGMESMSSEESFQIVLGFPVNFDKTDIGVDSLEPDGCYGIFTSVNFNNAHEKASKQFGKENVKLFFGGTTWG